MALERIDKILSNMGYGSRREVSSWAKKGAITADGEVCKSADIKVDPEKVAITLWGKEIKYAKYTYIMLNKAPGYISATEDAKQKTVLALLPERQQNMGLFSAGRLDKDTEGLLILTNDGALSHGLMSPKRHVDKVYYAHVTGNVTDADIAAFKAGITLGDGLLCMPAGLEILKSGDISEVLVTVREGKFHQVKRMCLACGHEVIFLKRLSIGPLKLDENLKTGEWRELSEDEVKCLKSLSGTE